MKKQDVRNKIVEAINIIYNEDKTVKKDIAVIELTESYRLFFRGNQDRMYVIYYHGVDAVDGYRCDMNDMELMANLFSNDVIDFLRKRGYEVNEG